MRIQLLKQNVYQFKSSRDTLGDIVSYQDYVDVIGQWEDIQFPAKFIQRIDKIQAHTDRNNRVFYTTFTTYQFQVMTPGLTKYKFDITYGECSHQIWRGEGLIRTIEDFYRL